MRYRLDIEYDGTAFVGWQRQELPNTVQQVLEEALKTCLRTDITVFGAGRTDTGVHALGQVAHFDYAGEVDPFRVRESLNALVRPYPLCVHAVVPVSEAFHARFSARQRTYLYKIQNTRFPPALDKNRVWWYVHPLNEKAMQEAADMLIGRHDFSTFRASECQAKSPVKTMDSVRVWREGDLILIEVKARSFLHHQVRNIVGSLVLVGNGRWGIDDFRRAFEACDRTKGGQTAPAAGLYFVSVRYPEPPL